MQLRPPSIDKGVTSFFWAFGLGLFLWLGMRAVRASVDIRADTLAIERHDRRIEVPCRSIARVVPWSVPLPGPGFALLLLSGRRLVWRIKSGDRSRVLDLAGGDMAAIQVQQVECQERHRSPGTSGGRREPGNRWRRSPPTRSPPPDDLPRRHRAQPRRARC